MSAGKVSSGRRLRRNQREVTPHVVPATVTRYVSKLVCGHEVWFNPPPEPTDIVYCRRCADWRGVTLASVEWFVRCVDCTTSWTRRYGADEMAARVSAAKHAMRYRTHTVALWHGSVLVANLGLDHPVISGLSDITGVTET